jgi:hypothetical protein
LDPIVRRIAASLLFRESEFLWDFSYMSSAPEYVKKGNVEKAFEKAGESGCVFEAVCDFSGEGDCSHLLFVVADEEELRKKILIVSTMSA